MQNEITAIFGQYDKAKRYKESLGEKGLYEQTKINSRFYSGNQWYGANCGNDRPLVRHNIIKRIGDFKMSQTLSSTLKVDFFADGVPYNKKGYDENKLKSLISNDDFTFSGEVSEEEINDVCKALCSYYELTAERLDFESLASKVLRQAYISGSGILYTYFDSEAGQCYKPGHTNGDITCEVLDIRDVYFADGSETDIQAQPYIILASMQNKDAVLRQAEHFGTKENLTSLKEDSDGKVLVLTKLFKVYSENGIKIHCLKATENGFLRHEYDTRLHLYPLSIFRFGESDDCAYGESEVTYLIPNQIAINRMITASVWSNISTGMPMMIVNGDTVTGEITNDPGQIVKIYGTNEDVAGAVKYVTPPDFTAGLNAAVNNLIDNTLTQSGANPAVLGDEQAQNASAISRLQSAALMPLNVLKNRFKEFLCQNARIWSDFWLNLYGKRKIRIEDESGVWYFPFDSQRYSEYGINVSIKSEEAETFASSDKISALTGLFDKGIISAKQYISCLPKDLIPQKQEILSTIKEETNET